MNIMMDTVLTHIISIGLFVLLVAAGIDKIKHRQEFVQTLGGYRLLPAGLVPVASVAIPMTEIVLAQVLVWLQAKLVVVAVAALLALYAGAIFINIRRGNLSLDCGCQFGEARQSISMALVYRNLVLAGATLLLLLPTMDRQFGVYDYGAMVFGLLVCTLFYVTVNRLIANATTYREIL